MPEEYPQPKPPFTPPGKPGGFKPPAPKLKPKASKPATSPPAFALKPKAPPLKEEATSPPHGSKPAAPPLFAKSVPKLSPKAPPTGGVPSMLTPSPKPTVGVTPKPVVPKPALPFKPPAPRLSAKTPALPKPAPAPPFSATPPPPKAVAPPVPPPEPLEEEDDDLDAIFREEMESYLPEFIRAFDTLAEKPDDEESWKQLKTRFHAIKGAANTVGLTDSGSRAAEAESRALEAVEFPESRVEDTRAFLHGVLRELCSPLQLEVPDLKPPVPTTPAETEPAAPSVGEPADEILTEATAPASPAISPNELPHLLKVWEEAPTGMNQQAFLDRTRAFRDSLDSSLPSLANSFSQLIEFCSGVPENPPPIFFAIIQRALDDACLYLEARRADPQLPWSRKWGFYFSSLEIALASASTAATESQADSDGSSAGGEPRDPEMVEAFVEEAGENLEPIEQALLAWENGDAPADRQAELRRHYHTLKGAANSVGLSELGADFHILEDAMESTDNATAGETMLPLLFRCLDDVRNYLRLLQSDPHSPWPGRWKQLFGKTNEVAGKPDEPDESPAAPSADTKPAPKPAERQMLRVEASQLQELMHLISELVADQSKIADALDQLKGIHREVREEADTGSMEEPLRLRLREVATRLNSLHKQLSGNDQSFRRTAKRIQSDLVELNMGPVGALFNRLSRAFRDACKEEGKEAKWIAEGANVHLDRAVVDQLYGPLLHVVRNAVAHGIESGDDRRAAGKDPCGNVTIRATSRADHVLIEIIDDGAGINEDAIRRKAIERGLLDASVDSIGKEQAIEILFSPGFSTKETVTNVAGRGVGLDVVKGDIEGLNGSVGVDYEHGKGTTWQIRVPLTLSASDALLVWAGDCKIALPLGMVDQCIRLTGAPFGADLIQPVSVGDEKLNCLNLCRFLGGGDDVSPTHAVLIDSGLTRGGLAVSGLVTRREIVVKDPGPILGKLSLYGGMTSDSDGSLIPVLQIPWILEWIHKRASSARQESPEPPALADTSVSQMEMEMPMPTETPESTESTDLSESPEPESPSPPPSAGPEEKGKGADPKPVEIRTILLADDSPSVRKVQEKELKRLGYEVILAKNGSEALECLKEHSIDLLITDWEMPIIDGQELIQSVRRSPEHANLPVVVISSKVNEAFEVEARKIGATACLAKPFQANQFSRLLHGLPETLGIEEKRRDAGGDHQA